MPAVHQTLFISDLHLEESRPHITEEFLYLLQKPGANVDALYILGDLFEAWIGDDDNTPFHQTIVSALKSATQNGLPIYFMYGNRDFLIGKQFLTKTGCKLLADEEKINLYGKPVLLMHGDTLCTQDIAYLKARKLGRNKLLQFLFSMTPLSFRKRFAEKMRMKSAKHTKSVASNIMDVTQDEVERVMLKHQVDYLIHGHTHRPAFHEFKIGENHKTRIVLDAWHEHGSILVWDEAGQKKVVPVID